MKNIEKSFETLRKSQEVIGKGKNREE